MAAAMGGGAMPAGGAVGKMPDTIDLTHYVSVAKCSVLNNDSATSVDTVLAGSGMLRSDADCDEQLLLYVEFTEKVKLRHLAVRADSEDEAKGATGPATVKLFANAPQMDFSDAESRKPSQELALREADLKGDRVDLKFVVFQSVQSVTVFVETNQGDSDVTFLNRVQFFGMPIEGTNMRELKKSG